MFESRLVTPALLASAAALGALPVLGYEDHAKIGIPEDVDPIHETYLPVMLEEDFPTITQRDVDAKPEVMREQRELLERRYDLSDRPSDAMMSGRRKPVQEGVRVRLPEGMTWDALAGMPPDEIRQQGLFPKGFLPLPHAKHETGGQVFPQTQIEDVREDKARSLERFDVEFDLPDHLTPEFPPPIFLSTRPDLGDVSQGELLTIKNYYDIMHGILTPVQMEGLRLLLTRNWPRHCLTA